MANTILSVNYWKSPAPPSEDFTYTVFLTIALITWIMTVFTWCGYKLWLMCLEEQEAKEEMILMQRNERGPVPVKVLLDQLKRTHSAMRSGRLIFASETAPEKNEGEMLNETGDHQ